MRHLSFCSCLSFLLSDLSEKVYIRLLVGGVFRFVVIVYVLFVLVFLGPWLSSNDMKVLSFGIAVAAFKI